MSLGAYTDHCLFWATLSALEQAGRNGAVAADHTAGTVDLKLKGFRSYWSFILVRASTKSKFAGQ